MQEKRMQKENDCAFVLNWRMRCWSRGGGGLLLVAWPGQGLHNKRRLIEHRATAGYYLYKFSVLGFSSDSSKVDLSSALAFLVGVVFCYLAAQQAWAIHTFTLYLVRIHMLNTVADTVIFHVRFIQVFPLLRSKLHIIMHTFSAILHIHSIGTKCSPRLRNVQRNRSVDGWLAGWLDGGACECVCECHYAHVQMEVYRLE